MKILIVTAAAALALAAGVAGCATETPYAPRVAGAHVGGYSEERLDGAHWVVRFSGNSLTSRETVERYLLYRAAELTIEQGYDWFDAGSTDTERKSRTVVEHDPFYDRGFGLEYGWGWRPYWRYYDRGGMWMTWDPWMGRPFWADTVQVREITRYVATVEIAMGKGAMPQDGRRVLDARQVVANLGPSIVRPKG